MKLFKYFILIFLLSSCIKFTSKSNQFEFIEYTKNLDNQNYIGKLVKYNNLNINNIDYFFSECIIEVNGNNLYFLNYRSDTLKKYNLNNIDIEYLENYIATKKHKNVWQTND